mgnify:CR=1 FL=1
MVNKHETGKRNYPLLIGCGSFDIPMELEAIKQWKINEPNCRVVVFENAGHCANMDVPQEFNETMEKFLDKRRIKKLIVNSYYTPSVIGCPYQRDFQIFLNLHMNMATLLAHKRLNL